MSSVEQMWTDMRRIVMYDVDGESEMGDPTIELVKAGVSCCSCAGIERLWDECRWCGERRCYYCRHLREVVCGPVDMDPPLNQPTDEDEDDLPDDTLDLQDNRMDAWSDDSDIEWE